MLCLFRRLAQLVCYLELVIGQLDSWITTFCSTATYRLFQFMVLGAFGNHQVAVLSNFLITYVQVVLLYLICSRSVVYLCLLSPIQDDAMAGRHRKRAPREEARTT